MDGLGERLRKFRKERRWSLEELALRTHVSLGRPIHYTTIGKIERSERGPSGEILVALAEALNVSVATLTGKSDGQYQFNEYAVPIIPFHAIANWRKAREAPEGWVHSPTSSLETFAVKVEAADVDLVASGDNVHIVVEPSQIELLDDRVYAVIDEKSVPSFRRIRWSPLRLESIGSGGNPRSTPLGQDPVKVIGRAIWVASEI